MIFWGDASPCACSGWRTPTAGWELHLLVWTWWRTSPSHITYNIQWLGWMQFLSRTGYSSSRCKEYFLLSNSHNADSLKPGFMQILNTTGQSWAVMASLVVLVTVCDGSTWLYISKKIWMLKAVRQEMRIKYQGSLGSNFPMLYPPFHPASASMRFSVEDMQIFTLGPNKLV